MAIYKKLKLCFIVLIFLTFLSFSLSINVKADNNINVNVNYVDSVSGHKLQNDTTISGKIGTNLNIIPPKINGYYFKGSSELINGKFSNNVSSINMYYVPASTNKDNSNNTTKQTKNSGDSNSTLIDKDKSGYHKSQSDNDRSTMADNNVNKLNPSTKSKDNSSSNLTNKESLNKNTNPDKKVNTNHKDKSDSDKNVTAKSHSNDKNIYIYMGIIIVLLAIIIPSYLVIRKNGKHFK
ncbi:MucBP domain-containing protein [Apilactobacillus quenuiae]|uniref:MucBP domain-containing protein n=1 Tax=Apilactobacillus quenuiae TaxID=2008377 RepID=UPI000D014D90|nr:MucBP domain-containing protein [Apilactobacillus quenuiae]